MNKGVRELGSAVMNASSDIAKNIEQSGADALENLGKSATNATQSLEREIKNSPLISMGVAFGLGLFAARMLRNH